jgi:hypothetical protein
VSRDFIVAQIHRNHQQLQDTADEKEQQLLRMLKFDDVHADAIDSTAGVAVARLCAGKLGQVSNLALVPNRKNPDFIGGNDKAI